MVDETSPGGVIRVRMTDVFGGNERWHAVETAVPPEALFAIAAREAGAGDWTPELSLELFLPRWGRLRPDAALTKQGLYEGCEVRWWLRKPAKSSSSPRAARAERIESFATGTRGASIEFVLGDITHQATDAIVNAANPSLRGGGGVDGAIHDAAGPSLARVGATLAPCRTGDAVLTPGFELLANWVIQTVGPIYDREGKGEASRLALAYSNSILLARHSGFATIAFPSISTGVYGYPLDEAADIAVKTVAAALDTPSSLVLARFVLFGPGAFDVYVAAASRLLSRPANSPS